MNIISAEWFNQFSKHSFEVMCFAETLEVSVETILKMMAEGKFETDLINGQVIVKPIPGNKLYELYVEAQLLETKELLN